jgi:hypothetical protein
VHIQASCQVVGRTFVEDGLLGIDPEFHQGVAVETIVVDRADATGLEMCPGAAIDEQSIFNLQKLSTLRLRECREKKSLSTQSVLSAD